MPGGRSRPLLQPAAVVSAVTPRALPHPEHPAAKLPGRASRVEVDVSSSAALGVFFSSNPRAGSLSRGCAWFKEKPASSKDAWRAREMLQLLPRLLSQSFSSLCGVTGGTNTKAGSLRDKATLDMTLRKGTRGSCLNKTSLCSEA